MNSTFEQKSTLPLSAAEVWRHVTTPEGINDELFPWLRMTIPAKLRGKAIDQLPCGQYLGRSWFLALGVLPVDFDDITLAEVGPDYRFKETSRMLGIRSWVHERTIRDIGGGSEVHDRLSFELRRPGVWIPGWRHVMMGILTFLFRHRHARLIRWAADREKHSN
ncbi:hypothetical protein [Paraburkholderia phenazinium]|jgi:ligand-binding SRPBCC domain-containing protein|uniref:Ligand-binding SRPBCC domain-containing protein n=1 Tax=Paraburkholderia phenazinium TaxID=60549 RepID=A0A1G7TRS0_9BURK|nr:hypothetical protein [Paraburkholderia phenazinium]SDG37968.1 hypothetical protein SAMN05216466_103136 [Paraburkholderia phenazinium]